MMDGTKILKNMKEDKQMARIPVIAVSVDSSPETTQKCRGFGRYDYLTKPVKMTDCTESCKSVSSAIQDPTGGI
jgi:CheY-like chemotaxis protein